MNQGSGAARRTAALVLYVLAGLGAVLGALTLVAVRENLRRNAATGDFVGASLGTAFLLVIVLPVTLAALLAALWLAPPGVGRGAAGRDSGGEPAGAGSPRTTAVRRALVPVLLVAALAVVGIGGTILASALRGPHPNHGPLGWIGLVIQDLIVCSPLLVLAAVLVWIAAAMARRAARRR